MVDLAQTISACGAVIGGVSAFIMLLIVIHMAKQPRPQAGSLKFWFDLSRSALFAGPAILFTTAMLIDPAGAPPWGIVVFWDLLLVGYIGWNYRMWRKEQRDTL